MKRSVIKDALDILRDVDVLNPERCAQVIDDAVRMVQAELDKAPKVLTDEEIERIADTTPPPSKANSYAEYCAEEAGFVRGLRYARDHYGIGAQVPAAGLTVEEAVQVVKEWVLEWCDWSMIDSEDGSNLRARLAAKLNTTEQ